MSERFTHWKPPRIEHGKLTEWNWMVQYPEKLALGERTDIGAFTYINAKYGVSIGKDVQIGSHCSLYSESTIDKTQGKITIEDGACVGSHSLVMPGVTIGRGAIVGAFSFVTKDVPANTVVVGVPARILKKRQTRE
jgi:acetyltransferase-like isoleucine patch superfamily enzyme